MLSPEILAAYITAASSAIIFGGMAGYERFITRKKTAKTEAKSEAEERALSEALSYKKSYELMLTQAETMRVLLEKEYTAHQATREFHHDASKEAQAKLSKCNEQCLELKERTDISRVEQIMTQQMQTMQQQSESMQRIAAGITELLQRTIPS